jgi:hypothetical protein
LLEDGYGILGLLLATAASLAGGGGCHCGGKGIGGPSSPCAASRIDEMERRHPREDDDDDVSTTAGWRKAWVVVARRRKGSRRRTMATGRHRRGRSCRSYRKNQQPGPLRLLMGNVCKTDGGSFRNVTRQKQTSTMCNDYSTIRMTTQLLIALFI